MWLFARVTASMCHTLKYGEKVSGILNVYFLSAGLPIFVIGDSRFTITKSALTNMGKIFFTGWTGSFLIYGTNL